MVRLSRTRAVTRLSLMLFAAGATLLFSIPTTPVAASELKVHGSSTVTQWILGPNKTAIEKDTGLTLDLVANGSGNGLKDLAAGNADMAMISAPLASEVDGANKKAPGSLDAAVFVQAPIGFVATKIIVNPNNPVKTLTADQIKDIFTGKIASWKDVGGPDQPIIVAVEGPGAGTRTLIENNLLGGGAITDKARVVQAVTQVALIVGQAPNAIGYGNAASITSAVAVVPGIEIRQPLILITKGAANGDASKLIAAATKLGAAM